MAAAASPVENSMEPYSGVAAVRVKPHMSLVKPGMLEVPLVVVPFKLKSPLSGLVNKARMAVLLLVEKFLASMELLCVLARS